MDERCIGDQPGARLHLQPAVHHRLLDHGAARSRRAPATHAFRTRDARGHAESGDGERDGDPDLACRRDDVRARVRHRRARGRRAQSAHQCRPQHGSGLHRRLVHGRGVRRCRKPARDLRRCNDARHREQATRAGDRNRARQDPRAGQHHRLHPAPTPRVVRPVWAGGRGMSESPVHGSGGPGRSPTAAVLGVALVVVSVVGVLNQAVGESSALHVPTYVVTLLGKYACYALLAVALDLVWGYLGILSLGHGAFFALGGYAMGMHLMREIGPRGVYGHPVLPDFMVFLDWKTLPWYWHGFDSFAFALVMVVLVPAALAFVFGWLAFRSRVTGVYLSIMTQALTYALMLAFFRNEMGFGGNNGLTDFKDVLGLDLQSDATRVGLFVCSTMALAAGYLLARGIVRSRLGRVVTAIRDGEGRVRSLGYRPERYKLFVFTVSAAMAGVAGALYVPQVGIINPGEFAPLSSIELVVWVAVGGRGTLHGAALGAVLVNYAKTWLTGTYPEVWLFALGAMFVVVTLVLPRGIVGLAATTRAAWARRVTGASRAPGEVVP
ncbi:MAG: urea ABC transporter permease subunit UrtC [Ectothiorhodospiraceae bacterium]|nr:urea ABC transporter permease subunit UrtC [Ectothiorhodospiraceae bacterium]